MADEIGPTQLTWDDDAGEALLAPAQRIANWRSFVAPMAGRTDAVVKDPELVRLAADVVAVFAEHSTVTGLTRHQLRWFLGPSGRGWPEAVVDARLGLLIEMRFLEPYLLKSHQDRYAMRPAGLAGAIASERLALHGGVDELVGLLDRTRELLERDDPDPALVLQELRTCRHGLTVFALDLHRQVATATPAELIGTQRQHDHTDFTRQVRALNDLVTRRFSGDLVLEDAAAALLEAAQFYRDQLLAAIGKILEQGGGSVNLDVLTAAEYLRTARMGGVGQLGHFGESLIADAAPLWMDGQTVVETASAYAPVCDLSSRPAGPLATPSEEDDPFTALEAAREHEELRRQVLLDGLADGRGRITVGGLLEDAGWPGAARILVDLLAVDADPGSPLQVQIAEQVRIDARARVTYLHAITVHGIHNPPEGTDAD